MFGRKAKIKWNGEEYELTVTMELVSAIDDEVNVLATAIELDKGGIPKVTLIAKLYAALLQSCGANVSKEQVYESIMSDPVSSTELVAACQDVLRLCFPQLESSERTNGKKDKG
jgi:hypothetical protein